MPMLVALPGLALVLVVAVGFSLRPLRHLADDVATRAPNRLTPISQHGHAARNPAAGQRLNELFAGIDRALENERRFTADASHELRTPLAALKAQAQVALAATDEANAAPCAGPDSGRLRPRDPPGDANADPGPARRRQRTGHADTGPAPDGRSGAGRRRRRGHRKRHCELALADGDARVRGDAALLQALLRNLVDNALRHGGARQIEIAIAQAGKDVVLTISG
jgi:two-component system sensor histidine kinase QseC